MSRRVGGGISPVADRHLAATRTTGSQTLPCCGIRRSGRRLFQPFLWGQRRHDTGATLQQLGVPGDLTRIKGVSYGDIHRVRTSLSSSTALFLLCQASLTCFANASQRASQSDAGGVSRSPDLSETSSAWGTPSDPINVTVSPRSSSSSKRLRSRSAISIGKVFDGISRLLDPFVSSSMPSTGLKVNDRGVALCVAPQLLWLAPGLGAFRAQTRALAGRSRPVVIVHCVQLPENRHPAEIRTGDYANSMASPKEKKRYCSAMAWW